MKNRNFATGQKIEELFAESIAEQTHVLERLKDEYSIEGDFVDTIVVKKHNKRDVRVRFDCGSHIDASVKTNTAKSYYNQLTRLTVDNFASSFGLSDEEREDLRYIVMEKCQNPKEVLLFPISERKKFEGIIRPVIDSILKRSFSDDPSSEILVLFNRNEGIMRIWKMEDVLAKISHAISYSKQGGNMIIGGCVYLQRKGGNGEYAAHIDRMSPDHPGNQIQPKLHIKKFIELHHQSMLIEYEVSVGIP